jgi:hypothetical protein
MFPSKEQVTCFYCDWNGRKDKAKDHCKKQHPDKKFKLRIAENNMEKFFQKQINHDTTTIQIANVDEQGQDEQISTVVSPSLSSLNTSHVSSPSSVSVCTSPTANSIPDQLASMSEQLKKITDAIEQMNLEKAKNQTPASAQSELVDIEKMFYNVKCSNDLYMLKHLEIDVNSGLITCIPCSKFKKQAAKHLLNTIKSSFGIFEYIEQDVHQLQSQRFRNLKQSLKVHYSNKLHIWCVEKDNQMKQEFEDFLRKNRKAGLNVGRTALFCIQNSLGGLKFVQSLNLLDLCGASIGTYR